MPQAAEVRLMDGAERRLLRVPARFQAGRGSADGERSGSLNFSYAGFGGNSEAHAFVMQSGQFKHLP